MQLVNGTLEYISTNSYPVISESNLILNRGVDVGFLLYAWLSGVGGPSN